MSQQLHEQRELRRSSRTRNRKSYSDYFSDDDMLTAEHEDDKDIEEKEDLLEEEEEYQDASDEEYLQEKDDENEARDDSSEYGSGKQEEEHKASVKDINTKFACGLCSNILSDPYIILACWHRFCCICIQESIKASIGPCPTCRDHSVSFQSLRRDELMGRLLTRYKMLQEKIQKKYDTREKRTFDAYEAVQEVMVIRKKQLKHWQEKGRRESHPRAGSTTSSLGEKVKHQFSLLDPRRLW